MNLFKKITAVVIAANVLITNAFAVNTYWSIDENPEPTGWIEWKNPDDLNMAGTALDASFILDAPAGKHGKIKTQGEDFYFEDGTKANFMGVNISHGANFSSYEDAEKLAARIARLGFNIARFHQLDMTGSDNIFGEGKVESTLEIDKNQLDKLFYLMAQLKQRGVYFYVDFFCFRQNAPEDGIEDMDIGKIWKFEGHFDPYLIELQKNYIKQLITTVNPYTGLALCDDPAFVMADIQNESGLYHVYGLKGKYKSQFTLMFNNWLKNKYSNNENLASAWYEDNKTGLAEGESLSDYSVKAVDDTTALVDYLNNSNYSTQRKTDTWEFVKDVMTDYYIDIKNYTQIELGAPCLITGSSTSSASEYAAHLLINKESMDYTDTHSYMSHPDNGYLPGSTTWVDSAFRYSWLLTYGINNRVYNQPFIMGEWNECLNNPYHAEMTLLAPAIYSYQNISSILYTMIGYPVSKESSINSFAIYNDPASTALWPSGNLMYHRREINEAQDSYYVKMNKADALVPGSKTAYDGRWAYSKAGTMFADMEDADLSKTNRPGKVDPQISDQMYFMGYPFYKSDNFYFTVDTDYTNGFTGFEKDVDMEFDESIIKMYNDFAAITLTSVTNEKLADSKRILLSAAGRVQNSGQEIEVLSDPDSFYEGVSLGKSKTTKIIKTGTAPVLAEATNADITLKTTESIIVYALNESGKRTSIVPVQKTADGYSKFNICSKYNALNYEIVKSDFTSEIDVDINSSSMVVKGVTPNDSVTVTVLKTGVDAGNFDIDDVYWLGQEKADDNGVFSAEIPFGDKASYGTYKVLVGADGVMPVSANATRNRDKSEIATNILAAGEGLSVSGNLYYPPNQSANNKIVTMVVTKADSNIEDTKDLSISNLYHIAQTRADENGEFDFNVNLYGANGGKYDVIVSSQGSDNEVLIYYNSFNFNPPAYRLNLYNNEDKGSILYDVAANQTITAVARLYNAKAKGVLLLALYDEDNTLKNTVLEKQKLNDDGELYATYTIPQDFSGGYIKVFLLEDFTTITPMTNELTIYSK